MKTLKKINDGFIKVSEYVAFVLSAIVCAMIVWWAFKRYVFASEFYGAEELILAIAFWIQILLFRSRQKSCFMNLLPSME